MKGVCEAGESKYILNCVPYFSQPENVEEVEDSEPAVKQSKLY